MLLRMRERYECNPLNAREVVVGGAKVELCRGLDPQSVIVKSIEAFEKNAGHGTAALREIIALAEMCKVDLHLHSVPFGDDGLSQNGLDEWYMKHGFVRASGDRFTRISPDAPAVPCEIGNKPRGCTERSRDFDL